MKITHDYTLNAVIGSMAIEQDAAVMPASLAVELLKSYTRTLTKRPADDVIDEYVVELKQCRNIKDAVALSMQFVHKRILIDNITNGRWDIYEVDQQASMQHSATILKPEPAMH